VPQLKFCFRPSFVFIRVNYAPASSTILFPYSLFAAQRRSSWLKLLVGALLIVAVTSCATMSTHQFAEPARDWQIRNGQLLYRTPQRTVIGDAFVRFSKAGDFELTFSKGPVTLFVLRQDAKFADVKGPLASLGWSGPIDRAPAQLHGWLGLRDELIRARDRRQVRHTSGSETFVFRF
jgi:hypothetical protein